MLFQEGESGVEDVIVHPWIDRTGEAVGDMEELVTEADRAPLARFDADSAPHIDQKIQSGCTRHVDRDGLAR